MQILTLLLLLSIRQDLWWSKGQRPKSILKYFERSTLIENPIKTQKVLKAIQKVYQDYNREQQKLRLAKGLAFINEQLPQVQDKAKRAEAALEEFRKRYKLIDPELQAKALADALNNIREEQRTNRQPLAERVAQAVHLHYLVCD